MDQEIFTSTIVTNSCKVAWTSEMDDDLLQSYEIYGEKWNELVDILDVENLTERDCEKRFKKLIVSLQKKWSPQQDILLRSLIVDQNLPIDVVALKLEKGRVDCEVRWKLINRSLPPDNPEISVNQTESRTPARNLEQLPLRPQKLQQQSLPSECNEQNLSQPGPDLFATHNKKVIHSSETENNYAIHSLSNDLHLANPVNTYGVVSRTNSSNNNEMISTNYDTSLTMIPMNTQNAQVLSFNSALIPTTSTEVSYTAIPYQHFTATPNSYQHFITPYKHITVNVNNTTAVSTINANNIALSSIGNCDPMSALTTQMPNSTTATIGAQQKPTAIPMYWSKDMISRLVTATNTIQGANFWDQVAAYVGHNVTAMHCYTKYKTSFCLYNTSAASWTDAERTVLKLLSTKQIPRIVVGGILRRSVKECKEECLRLYGHSLTHTVPATSATINKDTLQVANATKLFQEAIGKENEVVNEKKKQQQMPTKILERSPFVDWTDEMDGHLLDAIDALGTNQWVKVADRVAGRTNIAVSRGKCKSRYYTNIRIDHVWSPEQDEQLRSLVTANQSWEAICEVTQRSYVVCRYRWFYLDKWVKATPLTDATTSIVSTDNATANGTAVNRRRNTIAEDTLGTTTKQSDILSHKRKRSHTSSNGLLEQRQKASKQHSSLLPSHVLLNGLFETYKVNDISKESKEKNDRTTSTENNISVELTTTSSVAHDVEPVSEPWTTEEDSKLWHLRVHNHASWKEIAKKLGRTVHDCVDRWQIIGNNKKLKSHTATKTANTATNTKLTTSNSHSKKIIQTSDKRAKEKSGTTKLVTSPLNWSFDEIQKLIELKATWGGKMGWEDISIRMEKNIESCQQQWEHCKQMGNILPVLPLNSDNILDQIVEFSSKNIANNITSNSNETILSHKNSTHINSNTQKTDTNKEKDKKEEMNTIQTLLQDWTSEEIQQLVELRKIWLLGGSMTWEDIARKLEKTIVSCRKQWSYWLQERPNVLKQQSDKLLEQYEQCNASRYDINTYQQHVDKHNDGGAVHNNSEGADSSSLASDVGISDSEEEWTVEQLRQYKKRKGALPWHSDINITTATPATLSSASAAASILTKQQLPKDAVQFWTAEEDAKLRYSRKVSKLSWANVAIRLNKSVSDAQSRWEKIRKSHSSKQHETNKSTATDKPQHSTIDRRHKRAIDCHNNPVVTAKRGIPLETTMKLGSEPIKQLKRKRESTEPFNNFWTSDDDVRLTKYKANNTSWHRISKRLNKSMEDCQVRWIVLSSKRKGTLPNKVGVERHKNTSEIAMEDKTGNSDVKQTVWTAKEDASLLEHKVFRQRSFDTIGRILDRSEKDCAERFHILKRLVNEKMANAHLETQLQHQQQQQHQPQSQSESCVPLVDMPAVSELVNQSMASWTAEEDTELFRLRFVVKVGYEFITKRIKRPISDCRTRWYLLSLLDKKNDIHNNGSINCSINDSKNGDSNSNTQLSSTGDHLEEFEMDEAIFLAHSICENNADRNIENATSEHHNDGSGDENSSSDSDSAGDDDDISTSSSGTLVSDSSDDISINSTGTIASECDSFRESDVDEDSYQLYSSSDMSEFESEIESDNHSESSVHGASSDCCSKSLNSSTDINFGHNENQTLRLIHAALKGSSSANNSDSSGHSGMGEMDCGGIRSDIDGDLNSERDNEFDSASSSDIDSANSGVIGGTSCIGCNDNICDSIHSNHSDAGSSSDMDSLSIQSHDTLEMDMI